jgi:hypothetical protein
LPPANIEKPKLGFIQRFLRGYSISASESLMFIKRKGRFRIKWHTLCFFPQ